MVYKVIDLSNHNGNIDFSKAKSSGVWGVILRAGYTGYGASHKKCKDERFESYYTAAKKAGLNVGAYYYSGAMTESFAVDEAKYFLSLLKGKTFELPVYMDVEETHNPTNMAGLGKTKLSAIVKKWCATVENAGYFVGIYTAKSWANNYVDSSVLNRYTFWLAHWVSKTDYSGSYAMWQYSDSGKIPGIAGNVDLDYCYKDFPAIIKTAGLNGYVKESDKRYNITAKSLTKENAEKAIQILKNSGINATMTEAKA